MQRIPTKTPTVQKPCIDRASPEFSGLHNKKERQIFRFDVQYLVHLQGLEPWAHWLRVSCSTNWARGAYGDPYRNRTDVKGVRGLCLNRLTNGPYKSRRLPIFTRRFQRTIFGTSELNFCVRNGNRWNLTVIVTDQYDWFSITFLFYFVQCFYCNPAFKIVGNNSWIAFRNRCCFPRLSMLSCDEGRAFKTE